jgi:hypothetical protein
VTGHGDERSSAYRCVGRGRCLRAAERSDLELLQEWGRVAPEVSSDSKGLWFGITDLVQGGARRTLYVAGCPTFEPADSSGEWATDYCWWPADRFVALADFPMPGQPYQDVLACAAALVRSLDLTKVPNVEGAAVGVDDGDLVIL